MLISLMWVAMLQEREFDVIFILSFPIPVNMQILIKYPSTTRFKIFTVNLEPSDTIKYVRCLIQDLEGIPSDLGYLTFRGHHLTDDSTLSDNKIHEDCTLNLCFRLRGMISNFSEMDQSDPLNEFLMKGTVTKLELSEKLLEKKRSELSGSRNSEIKLLHTSETVLNECQRNKLIGVADDHKLGHMFICGMLAWLGNTRCTQHR